MTEITDRLVGELPRANTRTAPAADGLLAGAHNQTLHYFRGIAALGVMVYHASHFTREWRGDGRFLDVFGGFFGGYGVAIFFALSGYLMAGLLLRDAPGRFLVGRLARIYPPMLLMIGLFSMLFMLAGRPRGFDPLTFSLAPIGPRAYFLGIEWTLLYEMTYYVMLAALAFLGLRRHAPALMLGWLALLAVSWVWGKGSVDNLTPVLSGLPLSIINLPFVLGFLAAHAHQRGWLPPFLALAAAATAAAIPFLPQESFRLLMGLSAALLVAAVVRGWNWRPPAPLDRLGSRLGDASYVLYLCHVPTFLLAQMLLPASLPAPLFWLAMMAASLGLALLLGPADVALHRVCKRLVAKAPPLRLSALALAFIATFLVIAVQAEREVRANDAAEAIARQIMTQPLAPPPPALATAIDSVQPLEKGRWLVRGYAVDLDRPQRSIHVALRQNGESLVLDRMRRMRSATAKELGRADLADQRFGFSVMTPEGFDCGRGALDAVLLIEGVGPVALPTAELAPMCKR